MNSGRYETAGEVWVVLEGDECDAQWITGVFATEELADAYTFADITERTPCKWTLVTALPEPVVVKTRKWTIFVRSDNGERFEWGPRNDPHDEGVSYGTRFPGHDDTPNIRVRMRSAYGYRDAITIWVDGTDHALVDQTFDAEVERIRADFASIFAGLDDN